MLFLNPLVCPTLTWSATDHRVAASVGKLPGLVDADSTRRTRRDGHGAGKHRSSAAAAAHAAEVGNLGTQCFGERGWLRDENAGHLGHGGATHGHAEKNPLSMFFFFSWDWFLH